ETIYALSSGRPPAAIAVVRISGPRAGYALNALIGRIPDPRKAALARIRGRDGEIVDQALALWFPGPQSETGEDVAELQLHGGHAVIAAVFAALAQIDGLRMAEAGEFTRRAFENGKLDLTAVEGLADLVMAETEGQRRQAFRQMAGALRDRSEYWRTQLIQALALVEARIDFSDEADVPQDLVTPALRIARSLEGDIASVLAEGNRGERLREGFVVAIAGPPNAGKSTLLNRIAKREAAIVSPYAGTTRDVIEMHLDLDGLPVTLLDTAGIRETDDPVEIEGVRRARERAAAADLILWVVEAGDALRHDEVGSALRSRDEVGSFAHSRGVGAGMPARPLGGGEAGRATQLSPNENGLSSGESGRTPVWLIRNKIDLHQGLNERSELRIQRKGKSERSVRVNKPLKNMANKALTEKSEFEFTLNELKFDISAKTGEGFEALLNALECYAGKFLAGAESALVTRERHRRALEDALAALRRALAPDLASREDLLGEELRLAARALGRLTGRVDVDDVLDVIFRDFCIGK
ncbi:MAG TPA: tRNA uridine-5-carboxymethylaminomethyl(34) synthesis GTPase MnmE, partial [Pseudolabrys sp.]|nr:tRNA uridine-5-carboxymethylaminomethyl(34) synthesis GTPase MnmE [Pseudolabrys sp.]